MAIADNPEALRVLVESLGGSVVPGRTFRFDLPLSEVRRVIPRLAGATGLRVRKIDERTDDVTNGSIGRVQSVARLELYRAPEPTSYDCERSIMSAIIK